jgi:hypothetical protein
MVARLLSLCASPCSDAVSAHAASRTKGQTSRATRPPAYPSYGRRGNYPTVDSKGSPVLPSSTCPMLYHVSVHGARRRSQNGSVRRDEWESQGGAGEPTRCIGLCVQSFEKKICRTCVCRGLIELSTISNGSAPWWQAESLHKPLYFMQGCLTWRNHQCLLPPVGPVCVQSTRSW